MLVTERLIIQNCFHNLQMQYKGVADPSIASNNSNNDSPSLELLWEFKYDNVSNNQVTCMAWNPLIKDILACGYGQFDYKQPSPGLVLCWSFKNPKVQCYFILKFLTLF